MDDMFDELIEEFIAECSDMIEEIEAQLVSADSLNQDIANGLFRPIHSLKGSSASLGFQNVANAVHGAENLLSFFQKGDYESTNEKYLAFFLKFFDFIRKSFLILNEEKNDATCEEDSKEIIEEAKVLINSLTSGEDDDEAKEPVATAEPEPEVKKDDDEPQYIEDDPNETFDDDEDEMDFPAIEIDQEMIESFVAESRDIFGIVEEKLLALSKNPNDLPPLDEAFRQIHSFKGNCGIFSLPDLEKLSHRMENVLQELLANKIPSEAKVYDSILPIVDILKESVEDFTNTGKASDIIGLDLYLEVLDGLLQKTDSIVDASADIKLVDDTEDKEVEEIPVKKESETKPEPKKEPKAEAPKKVIAKPKEETPAAPKKTPPAPKKAPPAKLPAKKKDVSLTPIKRQDIRVDISKLDILNNLVGELVTVKTMVQEHLRLLSQGEEVDKTFRLLNRVTTDLQDISMSIRMIPIAGLFKKMIRIVHDISIKSGKKINFTFKGEDTEIDKTVIEKVSDPLVHMIRNAVDHGVESPEMREKIGKTLIGNVTLEARNEASEIWIILKDDGQGLNKEAIKEKLLLQELVTEEELETLPDSEIFAFIFNAGFSTAKKVTDVSGRGVGMDVVKTNINDIKGRIDINSIEGTGTTFTIKIPLTLAIIQGMMLEVGNTKYSIPIEVVKESVKIDKLKLTHPMEDQELVNIRGDMLPVLRLSKLHHIANAVEKVEDGILVIVENRGQKIALLIDRLIGQYETVVKPLPKYFKNIKGVSGCSILGNGDTSLILDVVTLIELARNI